MININDCIFVNPEDGSEIKWGDLTAEKKAEIRRELEHRNRRKNIYDAIECVKSVEFKRELAMDMFEHPEVITTSRRLFIYQDNIMVLVEHRPGIETKTKDLKEAIFRFCSQPDSRKRSMELENAVKNNEYITKRYHICGHCIVIVEILVKEV